MQLDEYWMTLRINQLTSPTLSTIDAKI